MARNSYRKKGSKIHLPNVFGNKRKLEAQFRVLRALI